jgi:urocanate hydratase
MLGFKRAGAIVFDNGNLIRTQAREGGVDRRLRHSDFHRGLSAPAVRARDRPVPLDFARQRPRRHPQDRRFLLEAFPDNRILTNWVALARRYVPFEGLPARIAWLGHGERTKLALAVNAWCARARCPARSRSPAIISTPAPWRIPTS